MRNLVKINFYRFFISLSISIFLYLIMPSNVCAISSDQIQSNSQLRTQNRFIKNLMAVGITFKQSGNNIDITIDEQKTLNAFPILESQGIVSKQDVEASIKAPLSVSVVLVGVSSSIRILNNFFKNNNSLEKIHINGYVIPLNRKSKKSCYSFEYDRNAFNKLNLNILTPRHFVNSTIGFVFSDWCTGKFNDEASKLNN